MTRAVSDWDRMPRSFMVEVSTEMLAEMLGDWSEPVQIHVTRCEAERGGYALVARRVAAGEAALRERLARDIEALPVPASRIGDTYNAAIDDVLALVRGGGAA